MKRSVIALGNFDGVHLGHQRILRDAASFARRKKLTSIALTFDPHPQQFIAPERGLKLLTTLQERKELIRAEGIEGIKVIRFDGRLRKLGYRDFVEKYLVKKLYAAYVFVGFDYNFGHGRLGDISKLRKLGRKFSFTVKMVKPVKTNKRTIKSSLIRGLATHGNFNRAVSLLGHPYLISGKVVKGNGRGKQLGFRTANLMIDKHKLIPQHGVYLARWRKRKCVVNIGARPTFGTDHVGVEVHVLDLSRDLYGKEMKVGLVRKVREEIQFSDVEDLKRRIAKDVAICRRAVI